MEKVSIRALLAGAVALAATCGAACDPQAKSATTSSGVVPGSAVTRPGVLSKEGESCTTTANCEDKLRCVGDVCRPQETSRLGEYFWAAGQVLLEKNQVPQAAEQLQRALSHFEADKKEPPAGLLCDYGAALRRKANDAKAAEQAARLLHRCLLGAPVGSPEHWRGLREISELEAAGLDPTLVARDSPADTYLVRAPSAPTVPQAIKVEVAKTQPSSDKGYEGWVKLLEGDAARDALTKCFQDWAQKAQKSRLTLGMPLKLRARLGDDDIYLGGILDVGTDAAARGDDAAASQCIKAGLAPLATEFAKSGSSDSWSGAVTLTLSGSAP
jgi:hypothetical protein